MNNLLEGTIELLKSLPESKQETIALSIIEQINNIKKKQSKGVLSKLKNVKIQAHEDFAENIDLYLNGEK
jgi:hypothetical protein